MSFLRLRFLALLYRSSEFTMDEKLSRLKAIGLVRVGEWKLAGDEIVCVLHQHVTSRNVLYAFSVDDELMYVGKTVQPFRSRMNGYRNPGATQTTNIRNNHNIRQSLQQGKTVEVYLLPDDGLLHYGGFHINLAAGLEDSVIRELDPPWNGAKEQAPDNTIQPAEPT